jgi:hypothetical protein
MDTNESLRCPNNPTDASEHGDPWSDDGRCYLCIGGIRVCDVCGERRAVTCEDNTPACRECDEAARWADEQLTACAEAARARGEAA